MSKKYEDYIESLDKKAAFLNWYFSLEEVDKINYFLAQRIGIVRVGDFECWESIEVDYIQNNKWNTYKIKKGVDETNKLNELIQSKHINRNKPVIMNG